MRFDITIPEKVQINEKKKRRIKKKVVVSKSANLEEKKHKIKHSAGSNKVKRIKSYSFSSSTGKKIRNTLVTQCKSEPVKPVINKKVELISKIGKGSSGTVYSCFVDGFICAMKEVSLTSAEIRELGDNLSSEITILESLPPHPNIVEYLFHERDNDYFKIYFKQYQYSLYDIIQKKIKLKSYFKVSQVIDILFQIANGLQFLHENNLIHRDIKPQNIFVQKTMQNSICVIGDLDSAIIVNKNKKACTILGTPAYMAPEVFLSEGETPYSNSADIYSFGMLIFELITLQVPYSDIKPLQVASNIINGIPPNMPQIDNEFDGLKELYISCTQRDPKQRPSALNICRMLSLMKKYNLSSSKENIYIKSSHF